MINQVQCAVCEQPAAAGLRFCLTDWTALTWQLRRPENFEAAKAHLLAHRDRRRVYGRGRSFAWPYTSLEQLANAGFELLSDDWRPRRCRVPGCGQEILFVRTPVTGDVVVVNRADARPHCTSCADPDWFARRQQQRLQTPAAKSKKRRTA